MNNSLMTFVRNGHFQNCLKCSIAAVQPGNRSFHTSNPERQIARKYVVKNYFQGPPKRSDFDIVEHELPALKDGEILVKAELISVDPYQRAYNLRSKLPYTQYGYQLGVVQESKDPNHPVGSRVISLKGWRDYSVINTSSHPFSDFYKLPDLQGLPNEYAMSAVGMIGATAYFGLLDICKPKSGETVAVTGAAGAVGTIVGQIAKVKGCKVIGFAGSDDKVEFLEKELGFDKAFNYKTANIGSALKSAAPEGIDCYFDNVGGEISSTIIGRMRNFGRVAICGSISSYNEDPRKMPKATILQPSLVFRQLKVEGFLVQRWAGPENRWPEAFADITKWIKNGQMKTHHHVTEGFENIFDAFTGMLEGKNTGKAIVKV
ncbi:prostaglandin reductase 1-like [Aricia agestis]|uniref:prostaglandin reductase 1-like n=1 Tax=Aricia agestis TaxID=91739 RepID=UPI001C20BED9|nr:prostaglandin reductase 1-like [Aricia agestis]